MWHNNYTSLGSIFVSPGSVTLHKLRKWGFGGRLQKFSYEDSCMFRIFFIILHSEKRLQLSTSPQEVLEQLIIKGLLFRIVSQTLRNSPQLSAQEFHFKTHNSTKDFTQQT